jgi:hypothetical protein
MSTEKRMTFVRYAEGKHQLVERAWNHVNVVRALVRDPELQIMLGVSEEALLLAFERVHKNQEEAEAEHFKAMEMLAESARKVES